MHRHWSEFGPPVYVAVAMYLGINTPKKSDPVITNFDDLVNYVGAMPGGASGPSPFPSLS